MQKLNKIQKKRVDFLINCNFVKSWDKQILKGIKGNNFKNVSISDNFLLIEIFKRYKGL
jgi:hypothetical protein